MQIEQQVALAPFTTLRIGGSARYFAAVSSISDVREALALARERLLPIFVLGGGSNLLVADAGFKGLVLKVAFPPTMVRSEREGAVYFDVSAGTDWDAFVLEACRQGLSGVECLAGIPGLTGGTPVQNVGAYGQEVAQTIDAVTALDLTDPAGEPRVFSNAECGFAYRHSRFNSTERERWLVLSVRFRLDPAARPNLSYADLKPLAGLGATPLDVYTFVRRVRAGKGMLIDSGQLDADARSAGSFFKNPVVGVDATERIASTLGLDPAAVPRWPAGEGRIKLPAAWLIERAGFSKGFALGAAGISSRHTLALINRTGHASCAELTALRDRIAAEVERRFGVALEQEPVLLGF